MITIKISSKNKQAGVVLVVSLIMLLLLTLIGVTGTQVTTLEEKMAGNSRDQNIAFQAAEATLVEAEKFILTNSTSAIITYNGAGGLLDQTDGEPGYFNAVTWSSDPLLTRSASTANFGEKFVNNAGDGISDPRYVIKKIGSIGPIGTDPPKSIFKITARAQGLNPGTQVILQEIFVRSN